MWALHAQVKAGLTEGQLEELVILREAYLGRACRTLEQRQLLWQLVRASLLGSSLAEGPATAESKICAFEKVLELRRNMDEYCANYAWMMRELLLRILAPLQVTHSYPSVVALFAICAWMFRALLPRILVPLQVTHAHPSVIFQCMPACPRLRNGCRCSVLQHVTQLPNFAFRKFISLLEGLQVAVFLEGRDRPLQAGHQVNQTVLLS